MMIELESVSTQLLALVLGVDDSYVRQLTLEKIIPVIKTTARSRNRYNLPAAIQAYLRFRTKAVADTPTGQELQAARRRKIEIEARLAELKLKEREGELGRLSVQNRKMFSDYSIVRQVVEQLPDVIFSELNGAGTPELRAKVDRLIGVAVEKMRVPAGAPPV